MKNKLRVPTIFTIVLLLCVFQIGNIFSVEKQTIFSKDLNDFISSIDLQVFNNDVEIDYNNNEKIPQVEGLKVRMNITFQETNNLQFDDEIAEENDGWIQTNENFISDSFTFLTNSYKGKLMDGSTEMGDFVLDSNRNLKIKYYDQYRGKNNIITNGNMVFEFELNKNNIKIDENNEATLKVGDKEFVFPFDFPNNMIVNKKVKQFEQIGTERIATYEIEVTTNGIINNIKLIDEMGSDLLFNSKNENTIPDLNDFILYEGTDVIDFPEGTTVTFNQNNSFELMIPNLGVDNQTLNYTIEYQARLDKSKFETGNSGTVTLTNTNNSVTATADNSSQSNDSTDLTDFVGESGLLDYKWIEKVGGALSDITGDGIVTVPWTITINSGAMFDVANKEIGDYLDSGSVLSYDLKNGIKVQKNGVDFITIPESELAFSDDKKGWTYVIPETWENAEYTFTYNTTYNENSFIGAAKDYKNNANYGPYKTVGSVKLGGIQTEINKEVLTYTYNTTTWKTTLMIPKDGLNVGKTAGMPSYFSDQLAQNINEQKIMEGSIKVTISENGPKVSSKVEVEKDQHSFNIYFGNENSLTEALSYFPEHTSDYQVVIEYTSETPVSTKEAQEKFNINEGKSLVNTATLKVGNLSTSKSANRVIEKVFEKSASSDSYTGEVTYSVIISARALDAGTSTLTIADHCSDNQEFVEGSAKLYQSSSKNDFKESNNHVTMLINDANKNEAEFTLSGLDNQGVNYYKLEYKTKVTDDSMNSTQGKIDLTNDVSSEYESNPGRFSDTCSIPFNNLLIDKKITQKPNKNNAFMVGYEININPLALNTLGANEDLVIRDTPSNNQVMDYDSITIRDMTNTRNLNNDEFRVAKDGDTLEFTIYGDEGKANNRYFKVQYNCKIVGELESTVNYTNTVNMQSIKSASSSKNENVFLTSFSYGSSGLRAYEFSIKKQAEDNLLQGLEGAEFRIYFNEYNELDQEKNLIATITTNADGIATFKDNNLDYMHTGNKLIIVESQAPKGYLLDSTPREIQFNDNTEGKTMLDNVELVNYGGTIYISDAVANNGFTFTKKFLKDGVEQDPSYLSATFGLFKENATQATYTSTSEKGIVGFANVEPGIYIIKEIASTSGYQISDLTYQVEVTENMDGSLSYALKDSDGKPIDSIEYVNNYNFGAFSFVKNGKYNNNLTVLKDVEFTLENKDANASNKMYVAKSNGKGVVSFEKIEQGSYVLKESKGIDKYIASDKTLDIYVDADGVVKNEDTKTVIDSEHISNLFVNNRVVGEFEFLKQDSKSGENLEGAEFILTSVEDKELVYKSTSDKNGVVSFKNIASGIYELSESKAPLGYEKTDNKAQITIDHTNGTISYNVDNLSETFANDLIVRSFSFTKKEKDSNNLIDGAKFALEQNGKEIYTAESNELGIVEFNGVAHGTYTLIENDQLAGYFLSKEKVEVKIDSYTGDITYSYDNKEIEIEELDNIFENERITSSFEFIKYNEGKTEVLSNAVFQLVDINDESIIYEAISDENGIVSFENIPTAIYHLSEIKAPHYYEVTNRDLTILIDDFTGEITVEDEQKNKYDVEEIEDLMVNSLAMTTQLIVNKVDEKGNALNGAEFILKENYEGEWIEIKGKNEGNVFTFDSLIAGQYVLIETKAPNGYLKGNDIHIEINDDMEIFVDGVSIDELTVVNYKTNGSVDTSDSSNVVGLLSLLIISSLILISKRKRT